MKYLLSFAALTLGALAQQPLTLHGPSAIRQNPVTLEKQLQQQQEIIIDNKDPTTQQPQISPEWAMIDDGNYISEEAISPKQLRPEEKHHRRQHQRHPRPNQNQMSDPAAGWNRGPRDQFNGPIGMPDQVEGEQFFNQHEEKEGGHFKGCKKFMKGKGVGHVVFFIIIGLLSLFLVKKCIKKHQRRIRQRQSQLPTDPSMIDDKINQHYAEIQRLTEMKNQMQRQVLVEPIIYHQAYPQEMEMSHQSHGRMVNENSYPVIAPQNIQNQQIPVGRPLFMGNPYNNQRIYRANQF